MRGWKILITFITNKCVMIRKIFIPRERKLVLELPEAFIGKEVEVLAFEVAEKNQAPEQTDPIEEKQERIRQILDRFSKYQVDMSDFKFDRDEANNYE